MYELIYDKLEAYVGTDLSIQEGNAGVAISTLSKKNLTPTTRRSPEHS